MRVTPIPSALGQSKPTKISAFCPTCLSGLDRAWNFCTHCGCRLRGGSSGVPRPVSAVADPTAPIAFDDTSPDPIPPVMGRTQVTRSPQPARPYSALPQQLHVERLAPIAPAGSGPTLDEQRLADGDTIELDRGASGLARPRGRLRYTDGRLVAVDDGVADGIWLRVDGPRRLRDGDEVRIGQQTLRFEAADGSGADALALSSYRGRLQTLHERRPVGSVHRVATRSLVLGRVSADVAFPRDPHVSATHARVGPSKGAVVVEDLGSKNGTFVRLRSGDRVPDGATLIVGRIVLRVSPCSGVASA